MKRKRELSPPRKFDGWGDGNLYGLPPRKKRKLKNTHPKKKNQTSSNSVYNFRNEKTLHWSIQERVELEKGKGRLPRNLISMGHGEGSLPKFNRHSVANRNIDMEKKTYKNRDRDNLIPFSKRMGYPVDVADLEYYYKFVFGITTCLIELKNYEYQARSSQRHFLVHQHQKLGHFTCCVNTSKGQQQAHDTVIKILRMLTGMVPCTREELNKYQIKKR